MKPFSITSSRRPRVLARGLLLVGLLLRAVVPAGFMPATVSDGWYLKLCPDGIPVQTMAALFGHEHDHHHNQASPNYGHCDLGEGLAAAVVHETTNLLPEIVHVDNEPTAPASLDAEDLTLPAYRSRAPPFPTFC